MDRCQYVQSVGLYRAAIVGNGSPVCRQRADYLKGENTTEILTDAAPSFGDEIKAEHITGYTDKDITFSGRPAHLAECEWFAPAASFGASFDSGTTGRIAILFDADTIG